MFVSSTATTVCVHSLLLSRSHRRRIPFSVCRIHLLKASRRRALRFASHPVADGKPMKDEQKNQTHHPLTFSCRCGACRGQSSSIIPNKWEVTSDPSLRAVCTAAVIALVPVPASALHWSSPPPTVAISPEEEVGPSPLAALRLMLTVDNRQRRRRWVPTSVDEDPLEDAEDSVAVHDGGGRATTTTTKLWYCSACRSRLFVTGMDDEAIIRLFAGALEEENDEGGAAGGEIEWGDAPSPSPSPSVSEVGKEETAAGEAHWFPTAADGATPGAPVVRLFHGDSTRHAGPETTTTTACRAEVTMEESEGNGSVASCCGCNTFICACGAVKAVSTVPVNQLQHCHCRMCRQIHGSPFVTWAPVPESAVSWEVKGARGRPHAP